MLGYLFWLASENITGPGREPSQDLCQHVDRVARIGEYGSAGQGAQPVLLEAGGDPEFVICNEVQHRAGMADTLPRT